MPKGKKNCLKGSKKEFQIMKIDKGCSPYIFFRNVFFLRKKCHEDSHFVVEINVSQGRAIGDQKLIGKV